VAATSNETEDSHAPENTDDDGEPMLPSEADAAKAEEDKVKMAEDKMKAYRMKRFKKKEKAFKSVEEAVNKDQDKPEEVEDNTSPSDSAEVVAESTSPKKKFQGIAKVRRRKVKEDQKKEEMLKMEGDEETSDVAVIMKERKSASAGKTLELLIIVFFLVSGYLIGYNSIVNSSSEILIAGMDGTVDMGEEVIGEMEDAGLHEIKRLKEQLMGSSEDSTLPSFDSTIDPVFGIDFDLLLMEDNFLNTLGRLAVGLHRFVTKIARVPFDMFVPKTWPIFCGISLAVRAGTYGVLGATGMPKKAAGGKDSKGIKEMALGFVRDMFPVVFTLWELYQLVIGDVLMIFTGLLFAMATTRVGAAEGDEVVGGVGAGEL
jgi:hypothetical protein